MTSIKYKFLLIIQNSFLQKFTRHFLRSFIRNNTCLNEIYFIDKEGNISNKIPSKYRKKIQVIVLGKNNIVEIHEPKFVNKLVVKVEGDNNIFKLDKNASINTLKASLGKETKIIIGKPFSCQGTHLLTRKTIGTNITIGEDCMFSYEIIVRTGDSHTIYDINTKECLNPSADIKIGNHVWVAPRVIIFKDTVVPDNSIVAAGAIVTRKFDTQNSIYAGVPAKIVRTGINWNVHPSHRWEDVKKFTDV